ncbi:MAG TPA: hypothetical protein VKK31_01120 [Thermoanaerobaculia bacterium]|nr:hypothetical protein [Thermoanaerobaculia bacterium]
MDDSEKTYGYSEDIYHGKHGRDAEKSYEYGAESSGDSEGSELSPEEAAIHIEGSHAGEENVPSGEAGEYDYGRQGEYAAVESFTWDLSGDDPEKEAQASDTEKREDERVGAPEIQNR